MPAPPPAVIRVSTFSMSTYRSDTDQVGGCGGRFLPVCAIVLARSHFASPTMLSKKGYEGRSNARVGLSSSAYSGLEVGCERDNL